jgi:hypothetical protein
MKTIFDVHGLNFNLIVIDSVVYQMYQRRKKALSAANA